MEWENACSICSCIVKQFALRYLKSLVTVSWMSLRFPTVCETNVDGDEEADEVVGLFDRCRRWRFCVSLRNRNISFLIRLTISPANARSGKRGKQKWSNTSFTFTFVNSIQLFEPEEIEVLFFIRVLNCFTSCLCISRWLFISTSSHDWGMLAFLSSRRSWRCQAVVVHVHVPSHCSLFQCVALSSIALKVPRTMTS